MCESYERGPSSPALAKATQVVVGIRILTGRGSALRVAAGATQRSALHALVVYRGFGRWDLIKRVSGRTVFLFLFFYPV